MPIDGEARSNSGLPGKLLSMIVCLSQLDMQRLEPANGKKVDAGESSLLPVDIEKARIEHAQVRGACGITLDGVFGGCQLQPHMQGSFDLFRQHCLPFSTLITV